MSDSHIADLISALEHTPDNPAVQKMLARAMLEADRPSDLVEEFERLGIEIQTLDQQLRIDIAKALLDSDSLDLAELYVPSDHPNAPIVTSWIALRRGDADTARQLYEDALAKNPAIQDTQLESQLDRRVVPLKAPARDTKLRSIANDDTDAEDVVTLLTPEQSRITFKDVGGLEAIKKQIRRKIITPFQKPSLFQKYRRSAGGGILMYGPPGCGKTLLARATAGECGATFMNVAITDVLDMYIGESERKLHALFEQARRQSPTVLFFDEVEALGGKRQFARESSTAKLISQFLTELDGFSDNNDGVLILAATNVPWNVDPAFRRPGRFDRVLFVPPPDRPAREEILAHLLADRPVADDIKLQTYAQRTSGFSGADLRNLVESAVDEAIEAAIDSGEETLINNSHLQQALSETRPTTLEWLTTARNYARYANEAGQYDDVLDFLKKNAKN